jgi:hypothetical protein
MVRGGYRVREALSIWRRADCSGLGRVSVAGTPETSDDLQKLEGIRSAWEGFFSDSTDRRGTMISRLR